MKNLKTWQIPRSDKRDRCHDCLTPFKLSHFKKKIGSIAVMRFPNICLACYKDRQSNQTYDEN